MTTFEFFKAYPISAILGIAIFFLLLFFPIIIIGLAVLGFLYSYFTKPKPSTINTYTASSPTYTSTHPIRGNRLMSSAERNAYLQSPKWQALRQQVKARDKVCQLTGATDNLEIHHITYDNLGNEYLDDLVLLSRKAHQFVHDYYGSYDRMNTYPITEKLRAAYALSLLNNP